VRLPFQETLVATQLLQDRADRVTVLRQLAPHLPESFLPQVLEMARSIEDKDLRADALRGLAARFPTVLPEALEATLATQDMTDRAGALRELASYVPESALPQALEAVRAIQDASDCAYALRELAPYLPETMLPDAIAALQSIECGYCRADALRGLLPQMNLTAMEFPAWCQTLHMLAYCDRTDLLTDLSRLSPAIWALGGKDALRATAQAIQAVGRQFP
jgi:hypothetical protein